MYVCQSQSPNSSHATPFPLSIHTFVLNKCAFFFFWLHWVFIAVHGLFSSCNELGLLFVAVCGLLTAVASLVAEHGL